MKRGKKLIALGAILVLLVVAYVAVLAMDSGDENEKTTESTTESILSVFTVSVDEVESLTWTQGGETVTLIQGEDWYYADDPDFPLDSEYVDPVIAAVTKQFYTRTITEGIDLEGFGLNDPQLSVQIKMQDGTVYDMDYGVLNSVTGHYYMKMQGDDKVYTMTEDGVSPFFVGIYDLVKVENIPAMTTITDMTMQRNGQTDYLHYSETGFDKLYSDEYTWVYEDVNGKYWELDEYKAQEYVREMTDMGWAGCVTYKATDAEFDSYGLLDPASAFTVHYTRTAAVEGSEEREVQAMSYTIYCGNTTGEEGKYTYARLGDSRYVYLILTETVEILRDKDIITDMGVAYICNIGFDDVERLTAKVNGETYVVNYAHETVTAEDGTETIETTRTGEGFEPRVSSIELLEECIAALARESVCEAADVAPQFTITIERDRENFGTLTLEFAPYDSNFYRCTFNGDSMNLVNKRDVSYMMQVLDMAVQGE